MTQQDKAKFYKMMVLFSHGTTQTKDRLIKDFGAALVNEAIEKRFIYPLNKEHLGVPIYGITEAGEEAWQ